MLGPVLDVFRLRQYFDVIVRARDLIEGVRDDAGFLDDVRRAVVALPIDAWPEPASPFRPIESRIVSETSPRVALCATGGSGALASVVGVARAFEERAMRPSLISLCSGSALFGFPVAAGVPADDVAAFTLGLRPPDYVDVDWRRLALLGPTLARGFAGIIRGERLEATYRELLGDMTLGEMPIPAYAPIWNIEDNHVEYLGPTTYPDVSVARAVRMAVSLPLFVTPVELGGSSWCDGGIVDIFPVIPALDLEPRADAVVAINGFYPPEFAGEDATGWEQRAASIVSIAGQVRTCQQSELARVNLRRLRAAMPVAMTEPVRYEKVRGLGFYRQFLNNREWPQFMRAGRASGLNALDELSSIARTAAAGDTRARLVTRLAAPELPSSESVPRASSALENDEPSIGHDAPPEPRRRGWYRRPRWTVSLVAAAVLVGGAIPFAIAWSDRGAKQASIAQAVQDFRKTHGAAISGFLRPPTGVYTFVGTGTEQLSLLKTAQHWGPRIPVTVTGDAQSCWTFRVDYSTHHWQSTRYCPEGRVLQQTNDTHVPELRLRRVDRQRPQRWCVHPADRSDPRRCQTRYAVAFVVHGTEHEPRHDIPRRRH